MPKLLAPLVALVAAGCYAPQVPLKTAEAASAKQPSSAYQRFLPIARDTEKMGVPWFGFFALDTQTGQLCRTADWQLKESWGTLPTCVSLSSGKFAGENTPSFKEWQDQQPAIPGRPKP
jgi:hypothetical protein